MFPGVRSSLVLDLSLLSGFQSYSYSSLKNSPSIQHCMVITTVNDVTVHHLYMDNNCKWIWISIYISKCIWIIMMIIMIIIIINDDKTFSLMEKRFCTMRDTEKGSLGYMEKRRGRREIEVTRRRRGGIKRGREQSSQ